MVTPRDTKYLLFCVCCVSVSVRVCGVVCCDNEQRCNRYSYCGKYRNMTICGDAAQNCVRNVAQNYDPPGRVSLSLSSPPLDFYLNLFQNCFDSKIGK
jgi:hypothetical protein